MNVMNGLVLIMGFGGRRRIGMVWGLGSRAFKALLLFCLQPGIEGIKGDKTMLEDLVVGPTEVAESF